MGGFFKRDDAKDKSDQQRIGETIKNLSDQIGALKLELRQRNEQIEQLTQQISNAQNQQATSDAARKEETVKATEEVLRDAQTQVRQLEARIAQMANDARQAAEAVEAPATAGGLAIGTTAWVRKAGGRNLRRRAAPGLSADIHDTLPPGTQLSLLEGPIKADDYTWWRVRVSDGREGWVAGEELVTQAE
ncbi:MAG TPA: SH3 domain-containing protein [Roseiflexaceae bacterium]|nr:SH3 domain-containing protein [Roseiflexaceae bacterium]